uniref:Putative LAGLIDADG homing endonuclease n=1 Tax=Rhexinema sarcinoideum TaxID=43261 RepID=A0A1B2RYR7_9CHLO|nr:putative LAGLIDADG homing endonuclease [Rhexinema sarcinoideum]
MIRKSKAKSSFKYQKGWKNLEVKISKELRDIIHGYVMSDGYIRNGILTVDQAFKQKLFVEWLYFKFQPIRTQKAIQECSRVHPQTQKTSRSLRFWTQALLHGFHNMWYEPYVNSSGVTKFRKKLPKSLPCFFNSTFITLWYAGDGTKTRGFVGAKFEVTALTVEERLLLKDLFLKKYGISVQILTAGISKKGKVQWVLKISAQDYPKFRSLITQMDLIPKIFPYKLHKKV